MLARLRTWLALLPIASCGRLLLNGGVIHCATQQLPAPTKVPEKRHKEDIVLKMELYTMDVQATLGLCL
jgi:hypothetical protein